MQILKTWQNWFIHQEILSEEGTIHSSYDNMHQIVDVACFTCHSGGPRSFFHPDLEAHFLFFLFILFVGLHKKRLWWFCMYILKISEELFLLCQIWRFEEENESRITINAFNTKHLTRHNILKQPSDGRTYEMERKRKKRRYASRYEWKSEPWSSGVAAKCANLYNIPHQ